MDKSDGLVIRAVRSASPERGRQIACPSLRAQAKRLGLHRKWGKIRGKNARGERHPLPPRECAGLRLPGTKSCRGCDKFSDLSARGDEFRIISREVMVTDHQPESDGYGSSARKVIVTGYQPKG